MSTDNNSKLPAGVHDEHHGKSGTYVVGTDGKRSPVSPDAEGYVTVGDQRLHRPNTAPHKDGDAPRNERGERVDRDAAQRAAAAPQPALPVPAATPPWAPPADAAAKKEQEGYVAWLVLAVIVCAALVVRWTLFGDVELELPPFAFVGFGFLKFNLKSLLLKAEVTYATDAVPVVATNAILARNVTIKPLRLMLDRRTFVVPNFGNQGQLVAGTFVEIDFDVEIAGAGAAGSAPGYGPALIACGLAETLTGGVSALYAPTSPVVTADKSCDIYFNLGGRLHKITGAMGDGKATLEAGKVPFFSFHFVGLFTVPSDVALAALTLTAFQKPLAVNNANTTPCTLGTYAGKFRKIELAFGNKLDYRNMPNTEAVRWLDRMSTASFTLESELIAGKDWWTIVKAETTVAFTVTQGTAGGNKVTIAAPVVQLLEPSLSDENGVAMETYPGDVKPSAAGNDDFSITVL